MPAQINRFKVFPSSFSHFSFSFQLPFVTDQPRLGIVPARDERKAGSHRGRSAGMRNYRARPYRLTTGRNRRPS